MPMPLLLPEQKLDIEFTLNLNGSGSFSVVPLGRNSTLQPNQQLAHPSGIPLAIFARQAWELTQQAMARSGKVHSLPTMAWQFLSR